MKIVQDCGGDVSTIVTFHLSQIFSAGFCNRYKELWIISKGAARKSDNSYNMKKRHYSGASRTKTMYYVRVNTSELDCGDETMDVEVSSDIYNSVVTDEYHEIKVITDTLVMGKKRVRIYY